MRAADAGPVPRAFVAVTEQLYTVPFVSPVTTSGDAAPLALKAPQVAVYEVIGDPPLDAGGVKAIVACALPAVALTIVGAPGTAAGVTLFDKDEAGPVPTAFVAFTVNVYVIALVSPATVIGEAAPVALTPPGADVTV